MFFVVFYGVQRKNLKCPIKELWRPWTIGFLLILFPFAAISWGQRFVAPTIGGIFNGTVPIWSFIAGAILLKGVDRFTWGERGVSRVIMHGVAVALHWAWQMGPVRLLRHAFNGVVLQLGQRADQKNYGG